MEAKILGADIVSATIRCVPGGIAAAMKEIEKARKRKALDNAKLQPKRLNTVQMTTPFPLEEHTPGKIKESMITFISYVL